MIKRRSLLKGAAGAGMFLSVSPFGATRVAAQEDDPPNEDPPNEDPPNDDPYASLVDPGLAYFRLLADRQLPLVENLVEAIRSDDLSQALDAYVDSRPPYEQIEVLAGDFEGTDTDIDARPASFDWGETDESFKGFHRIEMLLFGEEDLNSALPYAEELVESVKLLRQNLDERERFSSAGQFGGMIGLANEIGAKKITSEEETWSDQSLLIFRHNFRGIYSQYNAYAGLVRSLNEQVATDATAAFRRAEKSVRAFFRPFSTGSTIGFSQVPNSDRREIVRASNQLRDALVASAETLDLAESL